MGTLVSIDRGFAEMALHRTANAVGGQAIDGQWEGDRFRLSREAGDGWTLSMQLQPIKDSVYWEIAPNAHCGVWKEVGVSESQADAVKVAHAFLGGSRVWQEAYRTNLGPVASRIVGAYFAHAELACGEAPRGSHA